MDSSRKKNNHKKRILVVCQHYWPEGFRINDVVDFFVEKNLEVDVLCGIPNYPEGRFYTGYGYFKKRKQRHDNVNIYRVFEIPRGNNSNFMIFLNYISFPIASLAHLPKLLTKKYDKIYIHQLSPVMMGLAGIILAKIKNIETTTYVLDLWPENLYSVIQFKNKLIKSILSHHSAWYYKNSDKLVALSRKMKSRLQEATSSSKSIAILPQACEKVYENNIKDNQLIKKFKTGFNIVFAGNMSPAQSFSTMIEAAKILKSEGLGNINWIMVGDGMSRQWLQDEVRASGLGEIFFFEGHKKINEIPKYTYVADLLIGCLVKSAFLEATIPGKVMSYIAAGKPIVLAMDGEVQGLVNDKIKCGFVGPTEDPIALAANIRKVYEMRPKQRAKLGENARVYHKQ